MGIGVEAGFGLGRELEEPDVALGAGAGAAVLSQPPELTGCAFGAFPQLIRTGR